MSSKNHSRQNTNQNNKSLQRYKSSPKLMNYNYVDPCKRFGYQTTPNKLKPELNGTLYHHFKNRQSEEIKPFNHINRVPQPDTRRTINPELAPKPLIRCKSGDLELRHNKDSIFTLYSPPNNNLTTRNKNNNNPGISSYSYRPKIMPNSRNNQKNTFNILSPKNKKNDNNTVMYPYSKTFLSTYNIVEPEPYKFTKSQAEFSKYNLTSQIVSIPGCQKRDENDINDNKSEKYFQRINSKKDMMSYKEKLTRDFRSNVSCLPGSGTNDLKIKGVTKNVNQLKYFDNDIFNVKFDYKNNKIIYKSGKKYDPNKINNSESGLDPKRKGIMTNYKNYSQFNIS